MKKRNKTESFGLKVEVYNNNIEGALKKFKRKIKDSNILQEVRKRQYFTKPSDLKRQKKNITIFRNKYRQKTIK